MAIPEPRDGGRRHKTRTDDLVFLEAAPKRVVELYQYWETKRAGRAMPRRRDIAPEDFRWHLPGILLVDVEGVDESGVGIYRYRVVGTGEVRLRGHDPTGKLVQEGYFGPSVEDTITCYEWVRRERSLLFDTQLYRMRDGDWQEGVTLFLPLSEDGETVTQVLVYAEKCNPRPSEGRSGLGFPPLTDERH